MRSRAAHPIPYGVDTYRSPDCQCLWTWPDNSEAPLGCFSIKNSIVWYLFDCITACTDTCIRGSCKSITEIKFEVRQQSPGAVRIGRAVQNRNLSDALLEDSSSLKTSLHNGLVLVSLQPCSMHDASFVDKWAECGDRCSPSPSVVVSFYIHQLFQQVYRVDRYRGDVHCNTACKM